MYDVFLKKKKEKRGRETSFVKKFLHLLTTQQLIILFN